MKKAFQILSLLIISVFSFESASANVSLANETIKYKVIYKWGLVHKQAGTATIRLTRNGNTYHSLATAKSDPWADKFYRLRDTLRSTMHAPDYSPSRYEYIAHEDGKYSHDIVTFSKSGNTVTGKCTRTRKPKKEKIAKTEHRTLTADGMTVDMLSSFYYLRALDFQNMKPGEKKSINIFSGKRKELLTFTYSGQEQIKVDGKMQNTYKVTFTFTSDGKKKSSEPIQAWVSTGPQRIPLKLIGKLKIGQVQCIYYQ